jgi:hypothetical protein
MSSLLVVVDDRRVVISIVPAVEAVPTVDRHNAKTLHLLFNRLFPMLYY